MFTEVWTSARNRGGNNINVEHHTHVGRVGLPSLCDPTRHGRQRLKWEEKQHLKSFNAALIKRWLICMLINKVQMVKQTVTGVWGQRWTVKLRVHRNTLRGDRIRFKRKTNSTHKSFNQDFCCGLLKKKKLTCRFKTFPKFDKQVWNSACTWLRWLSF